MYGTNKPMDFLSAMNGKIVKKVKEDTPGAVPRKNKKDETVYELKSDNVTAMVTDVQIENTDFGKMLAIFLHGEDNGVEKDAKLSLILNSNPANCFLCCMENVDFTKPLTIQASEKEREDGSFSTSLFLKQNNELIKWAHKRDEPNGMPPKEKIIVNGEEQWDSTKKLEFFKKIINDVIIPKIKAGANYIPEKPLLPHIEIEDNPGQDDLPF